MKDSLRPSETSNQQDLFQQASKSRLLSFWDKLTSIYHWLSLKLGYPYRSLAETERWRVPTCVWIRQLKL